VNRRVIWSDRALDDLGLVARQDRRTAQRISDTIDQLADQNIGDVKKLESLTEVDRAMRRLLHGQDTGE
jgi:plasmid stabilization system protein ParE